jgi:hypothetical protein
MIEQNPRFIKKLVKSGPGFGLFYSERRTGVISNLCRTLLVALCLILSAYAPAQAGFKGEIDLEGGHSSNIGNSLDATLGEQNHWDQDLKVRLMWSGALGSGWSLDTAYLLEERHGGSVALSRRLKTMAPLFSIDPAETSLMDLDHTFTDSGRTYISQRIDRLALEYSDSHLVLRIGRQALTWGGGLVFHPMDLFNPFPPNATYTTYKSGTDMLYGQWLFDSGADLQGVVEPRRDPNTGNLASDQSSAGIKWHGFVGQNQQFGLDILLAQDYQAQVLGVGVSGALGGATWTAEVLPTRLDGGDVRTSYLANAQYAWAWGEKSINGYLEYFRNGFGVSGTDLTLIDLPAPLADRLARGELFTVSKNSLAAGVNLQWSTLLNLRPVLIFNLDDGSALFFGQAIYSLSQNTTLTLGFQWGAGETGSEYGGLETAPDSEIYATPADLIYARFTLYF